MEPSRTVLILITLVLASLSVAATNDPFTITPTEGIAPLTISYACTANTGIAPYSYAIGFGDGSQTSDRSGSYTYHAAGTYTVTCTARDAIGRPSTYAKQITVHPNTPITASLTVSPTSGYAPLTSSYSCSATGGIAPYSYALAFGDGSQTSDRSGSYTFHAAGTYEVSCVARDAIGRSGTAKKTVTVDPVTPVKVALSVSPTSGRAPLTSAYSCSATGGIAPYSYALSFGDGSQTSDRSGSYTFHDPGTYAVSCTARDAIGQKGSASKTVTVDDPLAPLSVTYAVTPSNGQAPLTTAHLCSASGGLAPYSYTITTGDGRTITAPSATHVYARGSYTATCTVTDALGSSASRSRSVSVSAANTVPSASLSVTPTSGYAPLTVNYSCAVSGGDAPLSTIVTIGSYTTSALSGEVEFSNPGTYTVSCETIDDDGDRAVDSVTVSVHKAPSFSATLSVDPTSGYAPLTSAYSCSASGGIAPYSYALAFGDGSESSDRSGSYTFHAAGTYEVSCVARDAIGQQATAKRTVTVDPVTPVKVSLSVDPTEGSAPLTSSYSCSASGGIAPYSYAIAFGDGSQTSDRSGSYTFHDPGTYSVSCTARDAIGQKGSASKTVTVDEPVPPKDPLAVSLTASPASGYAPLIVSYSCDVSGGRAPISSIVRFGPSTTSALTGEIEFTTPGSYSIACEALDADGDFASDAAAITVLEAPKLSASLSIDPSSGPAPLAVSYACSASGGVPPYSYVIAFGDASSDMARTGSYTYLWPGTYTATCTAHDAIGQQATAKRTVTVDEPIPDLSVSYTVTPQHGPAPLTTEHVCSASGGVPPYAYVIDTADGPTVPAAAATYTYDAPGSYEASCTVTDARGSSRTAKKWVTAIEPVDPFEAALTAEPTSGFAPLTVGYSCSTSGGSLPHTVSVSVADLMTSAASGEIVFEYPGVFELRCDATDAKGAHASDAVTITVEDPAPGPYAIELSATPDRGLEPLDTRIRCDALGGHGALSYVVDFGVGPVLESSGPIDEMVRYSTYGVYDVTCTATDSLDRSMSGTVPVIVIPDSTVSIAPQDPMSDDDLVCRVDAYPEGSFDFTWYRNGELVVSSLSVSSSTIAQDQTAPGDVFTCVAKLPDVGDEIGRDTVTIGSDPVPDPLSISFFVSPTSGEAPLEVSYACDAFGGVPEYTYDLELRASDGAVTQLAGREGTLILGLAGTYAFTCTATDDADSSVTAERTVIVTPRDYEGDWSISAQPRSGPAPLLVTFAADTSDIPIVGDVEWDFADGHRASGSPRTHFFAKKGTYVVTAAATLDDGRVLTRSVTIEVGAPLEEDDPSVDLGRVRIEHTYAEIVGTTLYATITVSNDAGTTIDRSTASVYLPDLDAYAQTAVPRISDGSRATVRFFVELDRTAYDPIAVFVVQNEDIRLQDATIVIG